MNADAGGVNKNGGETVSLKLKKLKRKDEKRIKEKKRRKKEKKKRKHRISDSDPENRKKTKKFKERKSDKDAKTNAVDDRSVELPGPSVPTELLAEQAKARAPMTKEEWEKSQNVIRKVFDETTGRTRLIRGDGEILEEIVSRDRHREINKQATAGDGAYFQNQVQTDRN